MRDGKPRSAVQKNLDVLRYAALSGFHDFAAIFPPTAWVFGWLLRVVSQVLFFGFIGQLLGSRGLVEYLVIGSSVLIAAASSLTASVSTTWERGSGTLPLLVASPCSPLVVLMGRSVQWIPNGIASAAASLIIAGFIFDMSISPARFVGVLLLIVLVTASSYMLGTFLGALVLQVTALRRVVANLGRLILMAFCGVTVPIDYFPQFVEVLARLLPLTHGLVAIREVFGQGQVGVIVLNVALEIAVGTGWLLLSLFAFARLANEGRRNGSIVFTS